MPPEEEEVQSGAEPRGEGAEAGVEVVELWRLPLDFYELPLEAQWRAMAEVTVPARRLEGPRSPCPMAWGEQAAFVRWSLVTLGLPLAMVPLTLALLVLRPGLLVYWLGLLAVLALHPVPVYSLAARRQRIGVIMARYFSMTIVLDRRNPHLKHVCTPGVDASGAEGAVNALPAITLACPHGVLNFGAITFVYFERWIIGREQYSAGAPPMMHVPGIRYIIAALWFVHADRKTLKRSLQERPTPERPRGGIIGIVPDGIAGIFHSSPGKDVLHIGKKRGLMKIACEEGAMVCAAWFPGTTDAFNVVQDPCGVMQWVSRKLKVSLFLFYGRWGLPVPRRVPMAMVPTPLRAPKIESPSDDDAERLHQAVYGGMVAGFEAVKHYAGFGDRTLVVT